MKSVNDTKQKALHKDGLFIFLWCPEADQVCPEQTGTALAGPKGELQGCSLYQVCPEQTGTALAGPEGKIHGCIL